MLNNNNLLSELYSMFSKLDIDIIPNKSGNISLLLNNSKLLFTYIDYHNRTISFLNEIPTKNYRSKALYTFKIVNNPNIKFTKVFIDYLNNFWVRAYTIRLVNTRLYLSGYNLLNYDDNKSKILEPVFSKSRKKFYLNKNIADDIVIKYYNDYQLTID